MEVDVGATVTAITENHPQLQKSDIKLHTKTGDKRNVLVTIRVNFMEVPVV